MRHATILVAILAFVPLASATAQEQQPPLEPGARIRLQYCHPVPGALKCEEDEGKLVALTADSVVLEAGAVSRASVTKLEVSGPSHVGRGAVIGSVVGALFGWGSMVAQPDRVNECRTVTTLDWFAGGFRQGIDCETRDISKNYTVGVVVGALLGAVLGGRVGHELRSWREVPLDRLRVSLGPQRDGRFGFGASVKF